MSFFWGGGGGYLQVQVLFLNCMPAGGYLQVQVLFLNCMPAGKLYKYTDEPLLKLGLDQWAPPSSCTSCTHTLSSTLQELFERAAGSSLLPLQATRETRTNFHPYFCCWRGFCVGVFAQAVAPFP